MSLTTTDLKQIAALFNATIEPLIDHVDSIDQRLGRVDSHVVSIDQHVAVIDKRLDSIDQHVAVIDKRLDSIDQRLSTLSAEVKELGESLRGDIKELRVSVVQYQTSANANFIRIETKLDDYIEDTDSRFKMITFPRPN